MPLRAPRWAALEGPQPRPCHAPAGQPWLGHRPRDTRRDPAQHGADPDDNPDLPPLPDMPPPASLLTGGLVSRPPPQPPAGGHRPQHCPFERYAGQPWSEPPRSPTAGGLLPPPPLYSMDDDASELEQQGEVRHHAIGPDPDPTSPKPDPDIWHNASGPQLIPNSATATAPHDETCMGQGGRMGVMGAPCDFPCDPSPLGAQSPDPAPVAASPANTYGAGQDGDMGVMGDRSASPLETDQHPDPGPTLLLRAPNPDPDPTSTPPTAAHGTGWGVGVGVMGDRLDFIRTPDDDPAPIPIRGQDQAPQVQLCQPPPTLAPPSYGT